MACGGCVLVETEASGADALVLRGASLSIAIRDGEGLVVGVELAERISSSNELSNDEVLLLLGVLI